jgi:hypothetical protein
LIELFQNSTADAELQESTAYRMQPVGRSTCDGIDLNLAVERQNRTLGQVPLDRFFDVLETATLSKSCGTKN